MVVKVYGQIKAANPQRVLLCFLEKDIEFEVIHVDLDKLEQKKPQHLLRQVYKSQYFQYYHRKRVIHYVVYLY